MNRRVAATAVFASFATLCAASRDGAGSSDQVVIAEPAVAHETPARAVDGIQKVAVAARWEDRPCGDPGLRRWLEAQLDPGRFEFRCVDAVEATDRMRELSGQDLFVALPGGDEEAGLRAVTEALACRLPVLYPRRSAAGEVVGLGGVAYESDRDMLGRLETLATHLSAFRRCIWLPSMGDAVSAYLQLAR